MSEKTTKVNKGICLCHKRWGSTYRCSYCTHNMHMFACVLHDSDQDKQQPLQCHVDWTMAVTAAYSLRQHQRTCKGKNTKPIHAYRWQLYLYLTTGQAVVLVYHLNKLSESSPPVHLHPMLMKCGSKAFFRCCCVHKYEGWARSEVWGA